MSGARAAVALYVALALHLLALLLILLVPAPQLAAGAGQGLGLGLRLAGSEGVLALARPAPAERAEPTVPRAPRPDLGDSALPRTTSPVTSELGLPAARPEEGMAGGVEAAQTAEDATGFQSGEAVPERAGGGGEDSYFARLRRHLYRFRRDLPLDPSAGRAEVALVVEGDGRVSSLSLERRSLSAILDEEALALVRRAQPLPPPPGGASLRVVVPVLVEP